MSTFSISPPSFFSFFFHRKTSFFLHTITSWILSLLFIPPSYMQTHNLIEESIFVVMWFHIPEKKSNKRLLPTIKRGSLTRNFSILCCDYSFLETLFSSPLSFSFVDFMKKFSWRYFLEIEALWVRSTRKRFDCFGFFLSLWGWCQGNGFIDKHRRVQQNRFEGRTSQNCTSTSFKNCCYQIFGVILNAFVITL